MEKKMSKEELARWVKEYQQFLRARRIPYSTQKLLPTLIANFNPRIRLTFDSSGDSYTDGKHINLSLMHSFFNSRYTHDHWAVVLRAVTAHECQHINSTTRNSKKEVAEWYGEYLNKLHGINVQIGENLGGTFFNIFEDGRIEQIAVQHHSGVRIPLLFMNTEMMRDAVLPTSFSKGSEEFMWFQNQVLCYAKLGKNLRGFRDMKLSNPRFREKFMAIRAHIDNAANAVHCADCVAETKEALVKLADYFAELLKEDSDLADYLENLEPEDSYGDDEAETGDGSGSAGSGMSIRSNKNFKPSKDKGEDGAGKGGSEKGSSEGGGDGGDGDGAGTSADGDSDSTANPSSGIVDKRCGSGKCMDGDPEFDAPKYVDPGEEEDFDPGDLPYSEQELIEEMEKDTGASDSTPSKKPSKEEPNELSKKEKDALERKYKDDCYRTCRETFPLSTPAALPSDTMVKAAKLHRSLEKILKNRRREQRGQRKGVLDQRALWKVGTKSSEIFYRKGRPQDADCAVFELVDNSGSMSGVKSKIARTVAGALEVALDGLAALKISLFSVGWSGFCGDGAVLHHTVKDFRDKAKKNLSYAFGSLTDGSVIAGGGNKDGYSIRMATAELLKRKEKNKILIIVSDGEPTDYNGGVPAGVEDVKKAVAEAKKAGIIVVAFLIGDRDYVTNHNKRHREMYGKSLICCETENMLYEFEKLFKTLIKNM